MTLGELRAKLAEITLPDTTKMLLDVDNLFYGEVLSVTTDDEGLYVWISIAED